MDDLKRKILLFLALTTLLSAILWVPIIRAGSDGVGGGSYVMALMWCPGIAAILTRLITQRNLHGQGWKPRTAKLLGLAYILPVLYALPVYLLAWSAGLGAFDPSKWGASVGTNGAPLPSLALIASLGALISLLSAAGEEIGWRGLLVPELAKTTSFRNTAIISSVIWAAWHIPLIVGASYRGNGTPLWFSIACFVAMVMAIGTLMAWLRLRSGSLWPCALLHATHNLFVQAVFDGAMVDRGSVNYLTGEFGIGLAVTIGIAAWIAVRTFKPSPIVETSNA